MKLDNKDTIKQLVIYAFYYRDGIVGCYVSYMQKATCENCPELFVAVNGKLTEAGLEAA